MRQEQEVYHQLYKEKVENLVKIALADRLPELQNVSTSIDGKSDSEDDSDGEDLPKAKHTEPSSLKKIRALRMSIRREVRAEAWANETAEVRREVKEAMMREREGVAETKGDEDKVGLERSPESREL
jgi:phage protein D